jgi:hypothetical protein
MKATAALTFSTFSLACLLAGSQSFAASEKVYKWTDDKGQTHFGQRPPVNTKTEIIKPQTGHSEPVNYPVPSKDPVEQKNPHSTENKAAGKTKPLADKERCEAARKNAETLKTHVQIRIKGEDGQFRFLNPEEQKQQLAEATKAIEESCD